jgi:hypothetical protein
MATYDPAQLARYAARLQTRASFVAFVYAAAAGFAGLPLGTIAVVGINFIRRLQFIRSHEDAAELTHTDELVSLFNHAPIGALMTGVALGVVGLLAGLARSTELRVQGQSALCLLQMEANTRR